jgi:formamidopyrimidine-DNA glycosylase
MPELPDVQGLKQYMDATSLHQTICNVSIFDNRILKDVNASTLREHLKDAKLQSTSRHGKYLFASLSNGGNLVLHFGMTGDLLYHSNPEDEPDHTRFALIFANGSQLSFINVRRLGKVGFCENRKSFTHQRHLGPDALDPKLERDGFISKYKNRRGMIKPALMNQSIVAGIGNLYSDEILFQTGIHPRTKVKTLSEKTLGAIYKAMRRILKTAARHGGVPDELPKGWLLKSMQKGEDTCPRCHAKIKKVTVSGRTAHFCPNCQKR